MRIKKIIKYIFLISVIALCIHLSLEPLFTPTALATSSNHHYFPRYIAHKSLVAEDNIGNSLEAIRHAVSSYVDGIEIDVRLSKDNIAFIFHGERLEETTDGNGIPEEHTWEELQKLKYKSNETGILLLQEVFEIVGSQKYIFLDIKDSKTFNKKFAEVIVNLIKNYHLEDTVIVESFNPVFLSNMRLTDRGIMLMYDFTTDTKAGPKESQAQFNKIPWLLKQPFVQKQIRRIVRPDILGPRWNIPEKYLNDLIKHGYPVISWTVDDALTSKKLFDLGVKGLESNKPLELMENIINDSRFVYDAGGSKSIVQSVIHVKNEVDVINAISLAKAKNKKITIAGRRHSMGGQTILDNTIHLDMLGLNHVVYNTQTSNVTVGAGASWKKIQNILDKYGRSVKIMQSDNIFTVGGSISVNVHGWQVASSPISSSIISMKVLTAAGEVLKVSPYENPELFRAIIGGYGQFGIILEAELITVPNSTLQFKTAFMDPKNFRTNYAKFITSNPNVELAYGRLSVDSSNLFKEIGLFWYEKAQDISLDPIKSESIIAFKRGVFRLSQYSNFGKKTRWYAEKNYAIQQMKGALISRNNAMNTDIHILWPLYGNNKDILQEYFIPKYKLEEFLYKLKTHILDFNMNILNVTIREVKKDSISLLPYANQDMFGLVCLFSQAQDLRDEEQMKLFTNTIINNVLELGGTFYLPYRLHYNKRHLLKAYPNISSWIDLKHKLDPNGIFDSQFFQYVTDNVDQSSSGNPK